MLESCNRGGEKDKAPLFSLVPHSGPIYSLAFEDPWLVSASGDCRLAVMDFSKHTKLTPDYSQAKMRMKFPFQSKQTLAKKLQHIEPPLRMLHGIGRSLYSVDIGAERLVCGGDEKFVRIWDFSQALEIERRVQASRTIHFDNSMRTKKKKVEVWCSMDSFDVISSDLSQSNIYIYKYSGKSGLGSFSGIRAVPKSHPQEEHADPDRDFIQDMATTQRQLLQTMECMGSTLDRLALDRPRDRHDRRDRSVSTASGYRDHNKSPSELGNV
ncbi:hypothetical protein KI387_035922 [Taxus chinensis]|uniref:Uncharacterized protein n=1 Tax=Taxus chinensis TaxID=29808 RepID=A0AA38FPC8_TAXCH|nr:hypothetical protein KI387_035922 [Taxus chinensis]